MRGAGRSWEGPGMVCAQKAGGSDSQCDGKPFFLSYY